MAPYNLTPPLKLLKFLQVASLFEKVIYTIHQIYHAQWLENGFTIEKLLNHIIQNELNFLLKKKFNYFINIYILVTCVTYVLSKHYNHLKKQIPSYGNPLLFTSWSIPHVYGPTCLQGEIMVKRVKGAKLKVLFQGLPMTHVIFVLVYKLNFLYFKYPF